jgi:hypothetical protein
VGFAHPRRLRPGIGRLVGTADSFGSACDTNPERSAGIRLNRECTFNPNVGCVFDIDFGLARVTSSSNFIVSSSFIVGSNAACFKHIGTGAEIGCGANTASGHSSARVRGDCKNQRYTNRLHIRPGACGEYRLRVRIGVAGISIAFAWICARVRVGVPIWVRACGRRADASCQLGSSHRFVHPARDRRKANILDVSRR